MGILAEMREKQRISRLKEMKEKDEIERESHNTRPALSERISEELFSAVHQAVGNASLCWDKPGRGGVFDYKHAGEIAFELCHTIADEMDLERDRHIEEQHMMENGMYITVKEV